jgi:hypothetical protein
MVDLSGSRTMIGLLVDILLWQGTFSPLKWPVIPVSAIAVVGGAEPRVRVA